MNRQLRLAVGVGALGFVSAGSASAATTLFFDDFSSLAVPDGGFTTIGAGQATSTFTSGSNTYHVYGGDRFGLNGSHLGNIDLVSPSYPENLCDGRTCIDLDGTGVAGRREDYFYTEQSFNLNTTDTYRLTVNADTQNRGQTSSFFFGLLSAADPNYVVNSSSYATVPGTTFAGFHDYVFEFTLANLGLSTGTSARLFFENGSDDFSDNVGAVISSIRFENLTAVPLPAAAWLLLSGLAGVGAFARRKRQPAAA